MVRTTMNFLLTAVLALTTVYGAPLDARNWIAHDAVQPFPENAGSGESADLYLKYKPYLYVVDGCVPFPAVDANGNTNTGLKNTGSMNGDCTESTGQVYVRSSPYNGLFAIMYSWYFPKDQNNNYANSGHRHDWEDIVVWLSEQGPNAILKGVSYSSHGGYVKRASTFDMDGSNPKVQYYRLAGAATDHSLDSTSSKGGMQPLINWSQLPQAAKDALNQPKWGKGRAVVPFRDDNHQDSLGKAYDDKFKW